MESELNILIYDLIFSDITEFDIDVSKYITDIYEYEGFILDMKRILRKSKVKIIKSKVDLTATTAVWHLKVSK